MDGADTGFKEGEWRKGWVGTSFDAVVYSDLHEKIQKVLSTLTPRQEKVLRLRFGIDDFSDYSLGEIGLEFDLSRQSVRQIVAKALRILRHPSRATRLKVFGFESSGRRKEFKVYDLPLSKSATEKLTPWMGSDLRFLKLWNPGQARRFFSLTEGELESLRFGLGARGFYSGNIFNRGEEDLPAHPDAWDEFYRLSCVYYRDISKTSFPEILPNKGPIAADRSLGVPLPIETLSLEASVEKVLRLNGILLTSQLLEYSMQGLRKFLAVVDIISVERALKARGLSLLTEYKFPQFWELKVRQPLLKKSMAFLGGETGRLTRDTTVEALLFESSESLAQKFHMNPKKMDELKELLSLVGLKLEMKIPDETEYKPLAALRLRNSTLLTLTRAGIRTVGELDALSKTGLAQIPGLDTKAFEAIHHALYFADQ